jgi:hypothetical protein
MLQNAPVLELNNDLKEMVNTHENQKLPYVIIRGEVEALGSPITSVNNHNITGAIQKLSMKEHVVARGSSGFWFVEYVVVSIPVPCLYCIAIKDFSIFRLHDLIYFCPLTSDAHIFSIKNFPVSSHVYCGKLSFTL